MFFMVYEFLYVVVTELGLSSSVFLSLSALHFHMNEVFLTSLSVYAEKKNGFSPMSSMSAFFS